MLSSRIFRSAARARFRAVTALTHLKMGPASFRLKTFFVKYPMLGGKALDFANFCKVAELMKNKSHLTPEGLEEIRKIKAQMNKARLIEVRTTPRGSDPGGAEGVGLIPTRCGKQLTNYRR